MTVPYLVSSADNKLAYVLSLFSPDNNASASLSLLLILPLSLSCNVGFSLPLPLLMLFLAASFSLALSSSRRSLFLDSFSSSLSPTLKGSLSSASGAGASDVSGCHLADLPAEFGVGDGCRPSLRSKASTSSTGPDWGGAGVGLNRLGLARGLPELGRGCDGVPARCD